MPSAARTIHSSTSGTHFFQSLMVSCRPLCTRRRERLRQLGQVVHLAAHLAEQRVAGEVAARAHHQAREALAGVLGLQPGQDVGAETGRLHEYRLAGQIVRRQAVAAGGERRPAGGARSSGFIFGSPRKG